MVVVTALDIAAKIAAPGKQASAIATVVMGFTASLIIGVPLGRIVASQLGWKSVFGILALAGLVVMFVLYAIIPRVQGDKPMPLSKQLAFLKNGNVALGLAITFFWLGGYSIAYTYISPYLLDVAGLKEGILSGVLLAFGIASLLGSKFGGFSADKWGVFPTLSGGLLLHVIALLLLSLSVAYTHSWQLIVILLILWSFAAWSSGPTQQVNLVRIEPNYSGIMLSLNQSMMQLSMAAGAAIGGVMIERVSLPSITWVGMVGVAIAIVVASLLRMRMSAGREGIGEMN
jgi:DHA1 family putative efflux transporter-like MFS transporter